MTTSTLRRTVEPDHVSSGNDLDAVFEALPLPLDAATETLRSIIIREVRKIVKEEGVPINLLTHAEWTFVKNQVADYCTEMSPDQVAGTIIVLMQMVIQRKDR